MTKPKTKMHWSKKQLHDLKHMVETPATKTTGYQNAANHFGVSVNAVTIKYGRYLRTLKTKLPVKGVKSKKSAPGINIKIDDGGISNVKWEKFNSISLDIKHIRIDLENKKLTIIY